MNYYNSVQFLFDFFYNRLYKGSFKLDLDLNNHRKVIDSFQKLVTKQTNLPDVSVNYLIDYFCFSFHYWYSKKTKRNISLNWIVGKKTFGRWLEKKEGTDYYTSKFTKEFNINLDYLRQRLTENQIESRGLDCAEELEKTRFQGEARLFNCIQNTTLYNHRSTICLTCSMRTICKNMLKKTRPHLFSKRGYESA